MVRQRHRGADAAARRRRAERGRRARRRFTSQGLKLVGDLRVPDDSPFEAGGKLPALTLTGPLTGVKDQVVGNYAERLADEGFVTLAFDHRNFGDSEGEPRQHEDSAGKLADLRDAVGYLASRPEVDPDRIAVVGVCLGGGYAVRAGAFDPRVRAIAGVGGAYNSPHRLQGMLGADGYRGLLGGAIENLERERSGGEIAYVPAVAHRRPGADARARSRSTTTAPSARRAPSGRTG